MANPAGEPEGRGIVPGVYTLGGGVYYLDHEGDWHYWDHDRFRPLGGTTIGWNDPVRITRTREERER
jgi:hypothetical protein